MVSNTNKNGSGHRLNSDTTSHTSNVHFETSTILSVLNLFERKVIQNSEQLNFRAHIFLSEDVQMTMHK